MMLNCRAGVTSQRRTAGLQWASAGVSGGGEKVRVRITMNVETFRQVPVDIEVEQAVLGAVLVDNRRLEPLTTVLTEEEFYDPLHQRIYSTMLKVWEQGRAITPLTLKALMQNDPGVAEIGQDYFVNLAEAAP